MSNSARRLQVLRRCIFLIFDNKIAEARKTFPAVLSALKTRQARLALCSELIKYKDEQGHSNNQVVLEHQQFEMIVHLVNAALQDDSGLITYILFVAVNNQDRWKKKCSFHKCTIKVCVNYSRGCPSTAPLRLLRHTCQCSCCTVVPDTTCDARLRALEKNRLSSKSSSRV